MPMFGFYISLPFLIFALYRLIVVLYNYFTRPYLPTGIPTEKPLISVLITSIKDDGNTKEFLDSLLAQSYQNIEILVFGNKSAIKSIGIVQEYLNKDNRVKLIEGVSIPDGLIAKNFTKDYLFQQAKGQYIIFANDNIGFGKDSVANALSYMQINGLSLLTVFSTQSTVNQKNSIQDSIMLWLLLTLSPLKRIMNGSNPSNSVTSDQFMMFELNSYRSNRWHEKFKSSEDIDFVVGRLAKKNSFKIASVLGNKEIFFNTAELDSSDTSFFLFNFFGRNSKRIIVYSFASTFGILLAIFLLPFPLVFLYLFSIFYARMLFAMIVGKSPLLSIITLPVHHFVFLYLVVKNYKSWQRE